MVKWIPISMVNKCSKFCRSFYSHNIKSFFLSKLGVFYVQLIHVLLAVSFFILLELETKKATMFPSRPLFSI